VSRKHNKGRGSGINSPPEGAAFVWLTPEIIASPAFRALDLGAMHVFFRICLEHMAHGGKDNGRLPVTFSNFVAFGVRREFVARSIEIAQTMGFIEKVDAGRRAIGDFKGRAARYRLTWLGVRDPQNGDLPATNEWKKWGEYAFSDNDPVFEAAAKAAKSAVNEIVVRHRPKEKRLRSSPFGGNSNQASVAAAPDFRTLTENIDSSPLVRTRHVVHPSELENGPPVRTTGRSPPVRTGEKNFGDNRTAKKRSDNWVPRSAETLVVEKD
jgi:hypothetical protein